MSRVDPNDTYLKQGVPPDDPIYGRTVVYRGRCYLGGAVNYVLWGKMNSLCYQQLGKSIYSLKDSKTFAWLWKAVQYGAGDIATKQAAAFTEFGYTGRDPGSTSILATIIEGNVIPRDEGIGKWAPYLNCSDPWCSDVEPFLRSSCRP